MPVAASELTRLAREVDTIVVQNNQAGITIFHDEDAKITTEWAGKGDPNGGDVREVSARTLAHPQFRQNILRGIFSVETDSEALQDALDAQRAEWESRLQTKSDASDVLKRSSDNVVGRGQTCIAPQGRDVCGNIVLSLGSEKKTDRPPLCSEHISMANQYLATPTGRRDPVSGEEETVWRRTNVTRKRG